MPNNKVKSLKKLGKVENVHPYSRKAKQARRAMARDDRLAKGKDERNSFKVSPLVERYFFIKHAMDPSVTACSLQEMHDVIELWLARHEDELRAMREERDKAVHGKKSPKEELMEAMGKQERVEYETHGIVMPNLQSAKVVEALRKWEGDINQLDLIKTVLVRPPKKTSAAAAAAGSSGAASGSAAAGSGAGKPAFMQDVFAQKLAEMTGMTVEQ
ncbi:hypothetical protein BCR44DRAFT_34015 [Catenaria anguillulae PL171]|uniref:Translation machinery-associated protein 16 n=1 Tax=Catenaria anguillulae PL171 TaxID=765915 RepID=A0A1Y2HUD4_9FUNG|nr:hypothetical protein BCR44DRAFT_34015 [Catenaria anguillulae PL171]